MCSRSTYSSSDETTSGAEVNLGAMAAVGVNVITSPLLSIPVFARLDYVMRYNRYFTVTVAVGVTLH